MSDTTADIITMNIHYIDKIEFENHILIYLLNVKRRGAFFPDPGSVPGTDHQSVMDYLLGHPVFPILYLV
jgi:hypothetical protein